MARDDLTHATQSGLQAAFGRSLIQAHLLVYHETRSLLCDRELAVRSGPLQALPDPPTTVAHVLIAVHSRSIGFQPVVQNTAGLSCWIIMLRG